MNVMLLESERLVDEEGPIRLRALRVVSPPEPVDIVDIKGLSEMSGKDRQWFYTHRHRRRHGKPTLLLEPDADVSGMPVWWRSRAEQWVTTMDPDIPVGDPPQIVGLGEIAYMLDVEPRTPNIWMSTRKIFPQPDGEIGGPGRRGKVPYWRLERVVEWAQARGMPIVNPDISEEAVRAWEERKRAEAEQRRKLRARKQAAAKKTMKKATARKKTTTSRKKSR